MNDMSMAMTSSRAARCSAAHRSNQAGRPHVSGPGSATCALTGVPVSALPSADVAEVRALRHQPVVERRGLGAAGGLHRPGRVVALVDHAERLDRPGGAVLRVGLVAVQPVDVDAGDVDVRAAVDDPVRQGAAEPAAGEDADRVQPGRDEVVADLGRLADHRLQVGREALRAAEELRDADLGRDRDAAHRLLEVGTHPVPVRRQLAEREVVRDSGPPATARRRPRTGRASGRRPPRGSSRSWPGPPAPASRARSPGSPR